MKQTVYFLGGSPCSGKSTVAQMLAQKHNFLYYALDDKLFSYMEAAAQDGQPGCSRYFTLTSNEIWLRTPQVQCEDEIRLYREMFPYVAADLKQLDSARPILAEGAGFLPELMPQLAPNPKHYYCMLPTKDFQIEHYKKRAFVAQILQDCTDPETAFDNWMQRDILFADYVHSSAARHGNCVLSVDGSIAPKAVLALLERHFFEETLSSLREQL